MLKLQSLEARNVSTPWEQSQGTNPIAATPLGARDRVLCQSRSGMAAGPVLPSLGGWRAGWAAMAPLPQPTTPQLVLHNRTHQVEIF